HVSPAVGPGDDVVLVFRPERCMVSVTETSERNTWIGTVVASLFVGSHTEHLVHAADLPIRIWRPDGNLFEEEQKVWVTVPSTSLRALPADEAGGAADLSDGEMG